MTLSTNQNKGGYKRVIEEAVGQSNFGGRIGNDEMKMTRVTSVAVLLIFAVAYGMLN